MSSSVESFPSFVRFIVNRNDAHYNKEVLGLPRNLWSEDPVIQQFRFCNVDREHDAVTIWIKEHMRKPLYSSSNKTAIVLNMFLARVFNHPPSLEQVGVVRPTRESLGQAHDRILLYQQQGNKIMRGAYMMGAHGPKNKGKGVVGYYFGLAEHLLEKKEMFQHCYTLGEVAEVLCRTEGIGAFVANQVVTDLRYMPQFEMAEDWNSFLMCGPGTSRGLNHLSGRPVRKTSPQEQLVGEVIALREKVQKNAAIRNSRLRGDVFEDINNLSNCLCEFDKYVRGTYVLEGKENGGMSRMRLYAEKK